MGNRILGGRGTAVLMALLTVLGAGAWSKKGHQVVAYIAQRHMTETTYHKIDSILGGDNIVYWASWLDSARNDSRYAYTTNWHYINVDENQTYENRYYYAGGDGVYAVKTTQQTLSDPATSISDKALALKIAVHVIGDLHQPMHCGHRSDLGGNRITITFLGDRTNLHSVWDYSIVEAAHNWSYYQWQQNIDNVSDKEYWEMVSGDIDDWARQSVDVAAEIYDNFTAGISIDEYDVAYWTPTVERQLLRGGLRLSRWLNAIFDPESADVEEIDICPNERLEDVFTINGVCVMRKTSREEAARQLPPGFYIFGRSKMVITR